VDLLENQGGVYTIGYSLNAIDSNSRRGAKPRIGTGWTRCAVCAAVLAVSCGVVAFLFGRMERWTEFGFALAAATCFGLIAIELGWIRVSLVRRISEIEDQMKDQYPGPAGAQPNIDKRRDNCSDATESK
jgi:cytochrome bd-type quinol oxidase subunit 1